MFFIKHNSLQSDIFFNPIFIPCFSGLRFFRVQVFVGSGFSGSWFLWVQFFQGPVFSGSRFFRIQVFVGPGFLGSWFFWAQVFQGPGFSGSGSKIHLQALEGPGFIGSRFFMVQVFLGPCFSESWPRAQVQFQRQSFFFYYGYISCKNEKKSILYK